MNTQQERIAEFIDGHTDQIALNLRCTHDFFTSFFPIETITLTDGKDATGKIVTNPMICYGTFVQHIANGSSKSLPQVTIAATQQGFSIYFLGIRGKIDLRELSFDLGKVNVTGYCIRFKQWNEINQSTLKEIVLLSMQVTLT